MLPPHRKLPLNSLISLEQNLHSFFIADLISELTTFLPLLMLRIMLEVDIDIDDIHMSYLLVEFGYIQKFVSFLHAHLHTHMRFRHIHRFLCYFIASCGEYVTFRLFFRIPNSK